MINIYKKTLRDNRLIKLNKFAAGTWVYVETPTESEIDELSRNLELDSLLIRDATDPFEVPRMEIEDGKIYVFTRFFL